MVTIALPLTTRSQFAIECLTLKSAGVSHFGAEFGEEGLD